MKVDFSGALIDVDGTDALEQRNGKDKKPELVVMTAASAVMRALNHPEAPEGEKMDRYEIIKKIRKNPAEVELEEKEPEMVRASVAKYWPAFIYGQICELMDLK